MQAYCLRCKAKKELLNPETVIMRNGRPATKGVCGSCKSNMTRFGEVGPGRSIIRDPMTTEELLQILDECGGPENVGSRLVGKNLSGIDLSATTMRRIVNERYPEFNENPDLEPVWYSGERLYRLTVERAKDRGTTYRSDSDATAIGKKDGVNLRGINMRGTDLSNANLQGADMQSADLEGAFLYQADLRGARLQDTNLQHARLSRVRLEPLAEQPPWARQLTALQNANLSWANFVGATFGSTLLYHAKLDRTDLNREQVQNQVAEEQTGHWAEAADVYLRLKTNFVSIGRYTDASWAYVKERSMRRRESRHTKNYLAWLQDLFWYALCGYGEYPQLVLIWLATLTFLLFPLVYAALSTIGSEQTTWIGLSGYLHYLLISMASAATLTFASLELSNHGMVALAAIQASISVVLLALLVYSLGRRLAGH